MKRYLVFAGEHYYPRGGAKDFLVAVDSLDSVPMPNGGQEWLNVLDAETGAVVMKMLFEWTDGRLQWVKDEWEE